VQPANAQGEYYLPDVLPELRSDGHAIVAMLVDDPAVTLGVNDRVDLGDVRAIAQRRILETHMRAGVTIVDPATTFVDASVAIGPDTTIEPGTVIKGQTRIGGACHIAAHSYVVDSEVADDVKIGPFAYLRPGTVVRNAAKIGTFVEVKNSDIGEGAKVPHLSYIGDADVGDGSNLGAGTITANYDGFRKHRTRIGDRVHGGVDNSFVAPVEVGDDAWTAAGSVIVDDVPPGALGVAREPQSNVEGYDERKRAEEEKRRKADVD
jgi:bifunctional UDP-N-acetylglucosamine pyrophosphorylase / glucosamine-1-phosphate N-acetyltransferase